MEGAGWWCRGFSWEKKEKIRDFAGEKKQEEEEERRKKRRKAPPFQLEEEEEEEWVHKRQFGKQEIMLPPILFPKSAIKDRFR